MCTVNAMQVYLRSHTMLRFDSPSWRGAMLSALQHDSYARRRFLEVVASPEVPPGYMGPGDDVHSNCLCNSYLLLCDQAGPATPKCKIIAMQSCIRQDLMIPTCQASDYLRFACMKCRTAVPWLHPVYCPVPCCAPCCIILPLLSLPCQGLCWHTHCFITLHDLMCLCVRVQAEVRALVSELVSMALAGAAVHDGGTPNMMALSAQGGLQTDEPASPTVNAVETLLLRIKRGMRQEQSIGSNTTFGRHLMYPDVLTVLAVDSRSCTAYPTLAFWWHS